MNTGEDIQGLRKITDFTRLISIFILAIHFYLCCYQAFKAWGWTAEITDRLISNMARTGLSNGILIPKLSALLMLIISLVAVKGRKDEKIQKNVIVAYLLTGLLLYFISALCLYLYAPANIVAILYITITAIGYLLILTGGAMLTRLIKNGLSKDVFNSENETFPQEERLLENEYSINLPAKYRLRNKVRDSWINVINPFRGILVAGTPGAGKTYFVIRHIIDQHVKKGFSMFIYDFKFDDLSRIAYNKLLQYHGNYKVKPKFYAIDLENPKHRCNPLSPEGMEDITDAAEASRTIMLGLNRDWIKKQGDFFVESAVNFVTAVIWYLRKYREGKFCTLPHLIELIQFDYDPLFAILKEEEEIVPLINPFISALQRKAMPQLEGQIASTKIGLARLSSPQLYYVLSGNDFTLDLNNPEEPKIICVGNNPQKLQVYGAVLSLYISRVIKLVNRKGQLKSSLIFDEFPTIFFNNMDSLIAT
ncbi:MAG: conjugal transfer protein TraG, partial [Pedobacter sp.]